MWQHRNRRDFSERKKRAKTVNWLIFPTDVGAFWETVSGHTEHIWRSSVLFVFIIYKISLFNKKYLSLLRNEHVMRVPRYMYE